MRPDPERDALYAPPETAEDHAANRLWLMNGGVLALVLLGATNTGAIERWAAAQPPSWGTETVRLTAGVFAQRMTIAGLDQPKEAVRAVWADWRAADWPTLSWTQAGETERGEAASDREG